MIGASGGIGESVAAAFFKKGYNVVCGYHFNQMAAEALADKLTASCVGNYAAACVDVMDERVGKMNRAVALGVDVTDEQSVAAFFDEATKTFGRVDVLVNAGGVSRPNLLIDVKKEDICAEVGTNLVGVMLTCREAAKIMMRFGGGKIINIASVWGVVGSAVESTYSGAKAAISNFTQWLAVHFSKIGIRVNAIAPGFFSTKQNAALLWNADGTPTARTGKILAATPMGRFGEAEELVGAVLFLLNNDAASFITGVVLPIDGGFSAYSGV